MPRPDSHTSADEPIDANEAELLADAMAAFSTASRLRILYALAGGELGVEEVAAASGLNANLVSQQLRVLRQLRAVSVRRDGRRAFYSLYDHHMADLLAAIRHHGEHGVAAASRPVAAAQ